MQKIDVALSAFPNNEGAVQPDISTVDADANAAEAEYLRKNIEAYLYDYMTGPLGGDVDLGHAGKVEMYKAAFSETALNLFDPSLLERADDYSKEYGHNPLLNELAGVLASLDHNAGVYYSDEDVEGLFSVAASGLFNEKTRRQVRDNAPTLDLDQVVNASVRAVSSLDRESALAIVKNRSGGWKVADAAEYGQSEDFAPLEVLREDNSDKQGWNKYRFRATTYTRQPDDIHTRQIAEGWYTSEWYRNPNYWSTQLRSTIAGAAKDIGAQLANSNTRIVFSTEGGIFKGTATANTDLDTTCKIICDSPAGFEQARQIVQQHLSGKMASVSFRINERPPYVTFLYYDRSTGQSLRRSDHTGEYERQDNDGIEGDLVFETVRKNEKGIMITTPGNLVLFRESPVLDNEEETRVAISIADGTVHQVGNETRRWPPQSTRLPHANPWV